MKKILLAILVITLLAVISGCFLFRTKSVENSEFHAVIRDGELEITSKNAYPGIEISLKGIYEEEDIITSQEHLRIVFHKDGITKIAIVSTEGNIQSGILLVRVKGDFKSIQELDIQSTVGYLSDSGGIQLKETTTG
ncbi:hypothetical protein [Mesotoga sp.]|uniref:hypothetical protein n=1 Tax=Mesotoga sp. TaxID=2053577 RepID=UPI00345ECFBC